MISTVRDSVDIGDAIGRKVADVVGANPEIGGVIGSCVGVLIGVAIGAVIASKKPGI